MLYRKTLILLAARAFPAGMISHIPKSLRPPVASSLTKEIERKQERKAAGPTL
jgi:hypothetical protein